MSKRGVGRNYLYNLSYQILIMILPLITTPYISRILGATNLGTYSFTQSISSYFILFGSIGVALYGQREIAYYQNDIKKRSQVFWELVILRVITTCIALILYYITIQLYGQYYSVFLILMIDITASIFDISWFLQGLEDFKKVTIRNFIIKLISISLIFLLVKTPDDLLMYVIIYSLSTLIGNLSLWLYLPKLLIKTSIKSIRVMRHLKETIGLFLPQIAMSIYTMLDSTMIGLLSNTTEVGYYAQAQKIVKIALTVVSSMGTVMLPRIASKFAQKDFERIFEYLSKSFSFAFILAIPITFGIEATAKGFIPWFLGDGFEPSIGIMMVTSPVILMIALSNVVGMQYLLPTKHQKEFTLSVIVGSIINFVLNLILIPQFQSLGAAVATVIAETGVTVVQFWFVRKELPIRRILYLSKNYMIAGILMFMVVFVLGEILSVSIIDTVIQIFVGCIVYLSVLFILKDAFFRGLINRYHLKFWKN